MAAKIKEGLRDITQGVVERLKGGPKYADNLLGESLLDQLRKATAKELVGPNEELTSQVVDTINQDVANGKDSKEIAGLLRKRLRSDNPHKQWLAVLLVGRVMRDCSGTLGLHQEELLQEVARVMSRPARQDTSAGRTTRQAAKELLRSYGRAGTSAFRAANRSAFEPGASTEQYTAAINAAVAREAAQVIEEVNGLIETAKANTELLSEMLLSQQNGNGNGTGNGGAGAANGAGGSGGSGGDEFENELTRELATEVRELRSLFDAYLEQLQAMADEPGVEGLMVRALEAVDWMDGALSLQKDVASNQRELEQQAVAAGGGAGGAAGPGGGGPSGGAGPNLGGDLISLDDLAEALLPQPPPVLAGGQPMAAAAAGPSAAAASAMAAARPNPIDPFAALDPVAVQAVLSPTSSAPSPAGTTAGPPQQQQQQPTAAAAGHPPPPYAAAAPYGSAAFPQQQPSYGGAGTAAAPYPQHPPQYFQQHQPQYQQQPLQQPPSYGYSYGGSTVPFGAAACSQPPQQQPAVGVSPAASGNPFEAPAAGVSGGGGGGGNPFAAAVPPPAAPSGGSANAAAMDSEWAMFFANRTAAAAQPQPQAQPH